MSNTLKIAMAATVAASAAMFSVTATANATTFASWSVTDVAFGDTLNVRKYPSNGSQKQAAYPNATILQMTGKCTGGVNLLDIAGLPEWKQENKVRYRWCQVWHDPARDGNYLAGWVYGKYITPY